ncbi:MAG TPA: 2-phosphosulfolactate phosphatase [Pirellulaceae bacterium]|nr:2-phosphosulfolactate phosphatase [Pirellulaceae bacterium]
MPTPLDVYLLPSLVEPERLSGRLVVVMDVLRATTTIVYALASGARDVFICQEVDDARRLAANLPAALLAGERGGLRIDGFPLGNSPREYTPAAVGGRTVVFTTTNGTRAMARCSKARCVLLGAFVNFSAVCRELTAELSPPASSGVALVCAGTEGEVTGEDTLLAGAIVEELVQDRDNKCSLNDQAQIAADVWRACRSEDDGNDSLVRALRRSRGGRHLVEIGLESDIALAAGIDRFDLVPRLDLVKMRVTVA